MRKNGLGLFTEHFDVGGAFFERADVAALDENANLFDDIGIGERGDVAGVHGVGNGGENAAHDFSGARLGHVRNDVDHFRAGYFADHGFDRRNDFIFNRFFGKNAGFERDINFRHAAFHFVNDGNDGSFGDFGTGEASGFDLLGAEAVAGDVDDVIHAAEDAIVAVGGNHGAVACKVRPVLPLFALRVLAVFCVVLFDEALWVAPNGLHDAGPGIADAEVACGVLARFDFSSSFIPDRRIDAECGGAGAAGFHQIERGFCGDEEAAGFGLPPGVHDDRFALADNFVIPLPDFRLDGLADGGHVLEVVVVLFRLVGTGFAEHSNGGGRSVEDVDVEALGDAPGAAGVWEVGDPSVEDAGCGESQRAVNNVGMAGDPADIRHAPVDVFGMNVLVIPGGAGDVGEIAAGAMLAAFGLAGGTAGVHEEERSIGVLRDGLDGLSRKIFQNFVHIKIAAHDHRRFGSVVACIAAPDQDLVDVLAFFFCGCDGDIRVAFVIDLFSVAVIAVGVDEDAAAGIGGAKATSFAAETAEDDGMDDAEAR